MIVLGSNYRASGPPVYLPTTEAAADADTFVCEFLGGSAANETGVGLGLTGADIVFTQFGAVPAAAAGYRALTGGNMGFSATAAFAAAFLNGAEWTYAIKVKSVTQAANLYFWKWDTGTHELRPNMLNAAGRFSMNTIHNVGVGPGVGTAFPSTSSATWLCAWRKNGHIHLGYVTQEALPTGWDSFPSDQRGVIPGAPIFSGTWTDLYAVGHPTVCPVMSIGAVVASKIGLAAAPV